jgi:hypothetical protein
MKIIFFSSNRLEVVSLSNDLSSEGIPCQVREGIVLEAVAPQIPEAELWIQNDRDTHRAFMFCVERDAGFAKRRTPALDFDDLFPEANPRLPELAA